ncbi:MAG: DUF1799 domain-containing protein [Burkholderiales bacterium]
MDGSRLIEAAGVNGDFEVLPENVETVRLFLDCSTQWRVSGGAILGLDYAAVEAVMNMRGTENRNEVFEGIRIMERAVLEEWSRK